MPDDQTAAAILTRLTALETGQIALTQTLGLILDTLEQQTNLLTELAKAANADPGPSPVMQSLDELTGAVVQMGQGIEGLAQKLDDLPAALGAALGDEAGSGPAPAPAPEDGA